MHREDRTKQIISAYTNQFMHKHDGKKKMILGENQIRLINEKIENNKNKDLEIENLFPNSTKLSYEEMARLLNTDSRRIRYRITNLIKNKVIRGFSCILDYEKLGYTIRSIVEVEVPHNKTATVMEKLISSKEMMFVSQIIGYGKIQFDAYFHNQHEFQEFLQEKFHDIPNIKMEVYLGWNTIGKYYV